MNDDIKITVFAPTQRDMDTFWPADERTPAVLIRSVTIETPYATPEAAHNTLAFLAELITGSRIQEARIKEALRRPGAAQPHPQRDDDQPEYPDIPDEAIDEPSQRPATSKHTMVFLHGEDTTTSDRTVWRFNSDVVIHYDANGEELGSLEVAPDPLSAAVMASTFGPIFTYSMIVEDDPTDPWPETNE